MHTIVVSGSLAYDRIAVFPDVFKHHFVSDKLHNINVSFVVDTLKDNWGGTAGNIAYNCSLLGEKATIIAAAGNDFAPYRSYLSAFADLSLVTESRDIKTATCHITTDKGNNQIAAFYPGALSIPFSGNIPRADVAIVAPGNKEDMIKLPQIYREKSIPFFFDPGQMIPALNSEELLSCMKGSVGMLVNDYELGLIQEKMGLSEKELYSHVQLLIVTLAEKGVRLLGPAIDEYISACAVKAIDPTGAGDAFRGGFIKGYLHKLPLGTCAQLGCTLASFAVESEGTQNHKPSSTDIQSRYESTYTAWPL